MLVKIDGKLFSWHISYFCLVMDTVSALLVWPPAMPSARTTILCTEFKAIEVDLTLTTISDYISICMPSNRPKSSSADTRKNTNKAFLNRLDLFCLVQSSVGLFSGHCVSSCQQKTDGAIVYRWLISGVLDQPNLNHSVSPK